MNPPEEPSIDVELGGPGPNTGLTGPNTGLTGPNTGRTGPNTGRTGPNTGRTGPNSGVERDATGQPELLPDAETRRRKKRTNGSKLAIEWVVLVISALTIALLIKTFLFQAFVIPSESMEQTLHGCPGCSNDRILVNKLSYRLHDVNRGDIVVFEAPEGRQTDGIKDYVKRVIALPGEKIEVRENQIYVDDRPLEEPYINDACASQVADGLQAQLIPPDHVFVMGDNRCRSSDSRIFGPIPIDSIIGRAFVRIWPITRLKFL
jgi:signal peptidase I